jgi:hypothetical protein
MTEYDVQLTVQRALEKFPGEKPKEYLDGNVKERYEERQIKLDRARKQRKNERTAA